jgi:hypothetical protein
MSAGLLWHVDSARSFERCNGPYREFLEQLDYYQLFKNDSTTWRSTFA